MVVSLQALTLVAEIATRFLQPYYLILVFKSPFSFRGRTIIIKTK